jgi:NAD(P)-dependent dehydrogenase (short-subunit alcohol dehydrogenase family)
LNQTNRSRINGKICLITGSSRGIGFYTALGLANKGAHVIHVSHNRENVIQAHKIITQSYGEDSACFYVADLSSQSNIIQLASQIKKDYKSLDVLINNVGGWFPKLRESKDGIEMTFALNHLSYYLLTGLLFDLLQQSSYARIINVSSDAHKSLNGIKFDDIQFKSKYRAFPAYAQSKLANILFIYELDQRLKRSNITVNALHPGLVNSKLYRHYGVITPIIEFINSIIGKSSEEGAETSLYLATSSEVAGVSGKYFKEKLPIQSSPASYDKEAAKRLWRISEEMTGFSYLI